MNIDLGRVTPIYRGAYDAGESYELNDIVLHTDGALYWHTSETPTTGVAPTVTATWTLAFSGADVEAAIEAIKEDAEAIAFGTRGGLPVGSADPYYHNNAAWYASQASASATAAGNAKTAAETAQGKAEDAQEAAEDAQEAAETAQGKAEDAQEAAETAAATFSTDTTLSVSGKAADAAAVGAFNQYIGLREEEDRQILFGSVVEAVEDSYPELRSAPIHNAVTIGQSVYPRLDNTRLGLNAIKGRTVAFNQLVNHAGTAAGGINFTVSNGVVSFSGTASSAAAIYAEFALPSAHKVMILCTVTDDGSYVQLRRRTSGNYSAVFEGAYSSIVEMPSGTDLGQIRLRGMTAGTGYSGTFTMQIFDLTQMYGSTLADSIYAMEQATPGSGVAYVRARLPLDYYAYNAGTLTAPAVSGWGVTGKNICGGDALHNMILNAFPSSYVEDHATDGYVTVKATSGLGIVDAIKLPFKPNTQYTFILDYSKPSGSTITFRFLYTDGTYTPSPSVSIGRNIFAMRSEAGKTVAAIQRVSSNIAIDVYYATSGVFEGALSTSDYEPYTLTALTIPSTTLNGVGTAQDYIEAVEVAENDYKLVLTSNMASVNLGTLEWTLGQNAVCYTDSLNAIIKRPSYGTALTNSLCEIFTQVTVASVPNYFDYGDGVYTVSTNGNIYAKVSDSVATEDAFVAAVTGKYLCYETVTPVLTTIAEHLTLAEVSAIAENGGIVSIVNSNGDIVQPDAVFDTVVSRSAS